MSGALPPEMPVPGGPPPLPPIPGLLHPTSIRPIGSTLNSDQVLGFLLKQRETEPKDSDLGLPPGIGQYAAGLRPVPRPEGVEWQQEIRFERLGKTDSQIEMVARRYLKDAQDYNNSLSALRVEASEYYNGGKVGGEQEGRSKIVMTTVRDTIRSMLPSLLRVFTAVEDPVSFEPASNEILGNDQLATMLSRQATDYCRWSLFTANKGWQILHDVLLDALTRKAGWVRWHWGARKQIRIEVCEGLLAPQLQLLLSEPGIQAQRIVRRPMTQAEMQAIQKTPEGQLYLSQGGPPEYWAVTITRSAQQAWPIVEVVPPECVWVEANATTVQDARGIFQVRNVSVSDLIEMGLPEDKVWQAGSSGLASQQRLEAIARNQWRGQNLRTDPPSDRAMRLVRYVEGWIKTDADNDHRAELLHVHMLGESAKLIQWERSDEVPLACFTPYREPSQLIGNSVADMVMDLQRVESRVMRAVLDSLSQAMFPRTVMVLGQVNQADVRQTAIGSIIRVAQQGAVTELTKPFAGKEALPVMEVLEAIRESRTGITRASQGLTVDELQSTAPIAVSQQSSAAQDRLDMVARTLAETGLAPLYTGLLKMMARQQDRPNVIRIRGQWISIDPRALATMWETSVNVGGKGMPMERLAMLAQIAQKQEQIIQMGGLDNPLCGIPEYRNTLARMLETVSIADVSSYFKALPPGFAPPPAQPPPNTDLVLAQVQGQKTAADIENDRAKAQTDRARLLVEDDRERDKAALDAWSKTWVAAAQFGTSVPSLDQFKAAMKSTVPAVPLLGSVPPPMSSEPPATGQPSQPPQQARPPLPMMPPPGARPPMQPAPAPRPLPAPGGGAPDPATVLAQRQALMGRGPPSAYGQLANRAMVSPLFGPGGPPPSQGAQNAG